MTTKFRVSPVMTSSIPLHRYDVTAYIISMQRPVRSGSRAQLLNPLRISHPKIDKLACQVAERRESVRKQLRIVFP